MADNSVLDDILSQLSTASPTVSNPTPTQTPVGAPTPVATPKPQTPPVPNTQQSLRDKMKANNGASNSPVVMVQGDDYKEETPVAPTPQSTIISDDDDDDEDVKKKKGINPKILIGCIAAALVVGLIMVLSGGGKKEEVVEEVPLDTTLADEELVFIEPVFDNAYVGYTADEVNELRNIGLTGTEIESYQNQGVPYQTAFNITREQYWAAQLEYQLPLMDMSSDDYYKEISKTWLTLPERQDLPEWTEEGIAYSYSLKKNLDYEKVDVHGSQLFLKVYLDDNKHENWFFLNVTPQEWLLLEDAGNVVVDYTYTTHFKPYTNLFEAEEDTEDIFITAAKLNIITDTSTGGF